MEQKSQEYAVVKAKIHHYLLSKTDFIKVKDSMNDDQLRAFVDHAITNLCRETHTEISFDDRASVIREVVSSVISLGPVRPLMEDEEVTEIMINGPDKIYVQKHGQIELTDVKFRDNDHLSNTIQRLLSSSESGRRVDESSPYVDFSLPDGSRVNIIVNPCSLQGPVVTIRKFLRDIELVDDLIQRGTLNKKMALFLIAAVKAKLNIVFCGATGSGKTTTMNAFSRHIPEHERIVTIEDTAELRLIQEHVVRLQAKTENIEGKGAVTIGDLFVNSLRMRPDRILIGEIRGPEILDMVQSVSSGHAGCLSIIHADSPQECYNRMIMMMLMSGVRLTGEQIQEQVSRAVDLIVHAELFMDGVRRVVNITDLRYDKQAGKAYLEDVFTYIQSKVDADGKVHGDWQMSDQKPSFYDKFAKHNIALPKDFFPKG